MNEEIPEHVIWRVVDAWLAIPPYNGTNPYCHVQCPYFYECWPEESADEEDPWDNYTPNQE